MDERAPNEKVIEKVIYRELLWEDWLSDERARFSTWLGVLHALPARPQTKDWDEQLILWQKTFLEIIMDPLFKRVRTLKENNEKLEASLKERDEQITDILVKVQKWMNYYGPILKKLEEENKQIERVKKKWKTQ